MDKTIIWLIRGFQRNILFLNLPKKIFLPNKLRKELNEKLKISLSLREMSRHLKDFEKRDLIRCINGRDPYNRIYELTLKGQKKQKEIIELKL